MPTLNLAPHHLTMLRDESSIAEDVIQERGYRSLDDKEAYAALMALNFSKSQAKGGAGLLLPLHRTDGTPGITVYRPDQPRASKDGRLQKYLIPKGATSQIDCPPRCQAFLQDPQQPLWITEGQKKADSLVSHGAVALALLGVWNFMGTNAQGTRTILVDFDFVGWDSRDVRIVFDNDGMSKPSVRAALDRLTAHMQRKGATVRVVYLPMNNGVKLGVDDYFAQGHTLQDLEGLIEGPRPQPQPAPSRVELLSESPRCIQRPLALIDGRGYAAVWPWTKVTRTEGIDKQGNVIVLATPDVTQEQRLFIMRDDGVLFGDGGDQPMSELEMEVHLPEIPQREKLWTTPGFRAYRAGTRPEPAEVFAQVCAVVDRFIDFKRSLASQDGMCELVTAYVMATWFLDCFNVMGYLWPNGEKGSGKTQLLTVVAELGYLGHVLLAGGSFASLRDLSDYGATLCFDDAEKVMDVKQGDPDKRALLLAGNRKGNTIPIKEPVNGRKWRTRHVQTFCPRLFSAIRLPDPVLASRTIIVPLIRTANREKANADPLEYSLWPTPREQLVDNLWTLALAHRATVPRYDQEVITTTTLLGRNLEPWRALLTVAHWLTACGVPELADRLHALSVAYQKERLDLDGSDLIPLAIEAICDFGINPTPINPINPVNPITNGDSDNAEIRFFTANITKLMKEIAQSKETGPDSEKITARRVGRLFKSMRFEEVQRPSGKPQPGEPKPSRARQWKTTKGNIRHCLEAYHMDIPSEYKASSSLPSLHNTSISSSSPSKSNGVNGVNGVNGGNEANSPPLPPLSSLSTGASGAQPNTPNNNTTFNLPVQNPNGANGANGAPPPPHSAPPPAFETFTASALWCARCQAAQPTVSRGTDFHCAVCHNIVGTKTTSSGAPQNTQTSPPTASHVYGAHAATPPLTIGDLAYLLANDGAVQNDVPYTIIGIETGVVYQKWI